MSGTGQELDTKQRILKEGARLFAERGYDAVSVREVVESAGVKKPTLYYHFGNKEGLATEIFKLFFEEHIRLRKEVLSMGLGPEEAMSTHAARVTKWSVGNRDIILFAFSVWMGRSSLVSQKEFTQEFESTAHRSWVEYFVGTGMKPEQAIAARRLYWSQLLLASLQIAKSGDCPDDVEAFSKQMAHHTLFGVMCEDRDEK
ncbi:MAG: TetR/AcrR family transcriptional regulator [Planctomycetota bacterium]|jgi:AcrR family transcriptional regulator